MAFTEDTKYFDSLARAIEEICGPDVRIREKRAVYGGDIGSSYRLGMSDGRSLFMKTNTLTNPALFEAECAGLSALRSTHAIGIPGVYGYGIDRDRCMSFILMEFLPGGERIGPYWETFGRELAFMHLSKTSEFVPDFGRFGFVSDDFIGASVQINTPAETWTEFFRDSRLAVQLRMAENYLDSGLRRRSQHLLDHLSGYLTEPARPSLLHGDLWSGNHITGPDGRAWIIDPAVYVGHHEAELAMTELFGANPGIFYAAYEEVYPIDPDYRERRDLYNLYHLLNHLNLFGGSYLGSVRSIITRYA